MVVVTKRERGVGSEEVLGTVFYERYGSLVGLARLLLDRREDAEEVVQEAFARTLEGWDRVRSPSDPYPYVRRAVVNLARSGLRKRSVMRRVRLVPIDVPSPDVAVVASESRAELLEAVRVLPRRQREVVVLRYLEDCSTAETADALGISEGAVKTHLHRAMDAMAKTLEDKR